jgi:hypothetical protein
MQTHIYIPTYTFTRWHTHAHIPKYTHTYTHTRTHTHTHIVCNMFVSLVFSYSYYVLRNGIYNVKNGLDINMNIQSSGEYSESYLFPDSKLY